MKQYVLILTATALSGCASTQVGQTYQPGESIATVYKHQLNQIEVGKTTPDDLNLIFPQNKVSLKEKGQSYEIWQVVKQGDVDDSNFLMWGVTAHYKDQALYFRFEHGVLVSYTSEVLN